VKNKLNDLISRQTLYIEKEKFALGELTSLSFSLFIERKTVQVPKTCMLQCGSYFYSVPHELCGEKVELFIREKSLTVFHKGIEKVCHDLKDESREKLTEVYNKSHPSALNKKSLFIEA
jgi:hypothetical protein